MKRTLPSLPAIAVAAAIAFSLASCGRRGPLEPPPGVPASHAPITGTPGNYEVPANPGVLTGQNSAASGSAKTPTAAKQSPPHAPRPFFLDPLL